MLGRVCVCLLAVGWATAPQQSDQSFVCLPDLATGFRFDSASREWHTATFETHERYVISRSSRPGRQWEVKEVGNSTPIAWCKADFTEGGTLACDGFQTFKMNRTTMRYLSAYLLGYFYQGAAAPDTSLAREGGDTPYIEIGRCSSL